MAPDSPEAAPPPRLSSAIVDELVHAGAPVAELLRDNPLHLCEAEDTLHREPGCASAPTRPYTPHLVCEGPQSAYRRQVAGSHKWVGEALCTACGADTHPLSRAVSTVWFHAGRLLHDVAGADDWARHARGVQGMKNAASVLLDATTAVHTADLTGGMLEGESLPAAVLDWTRSLRPLLLERLDAARVHLLERWRSGPPGPTTQLVVFRDLRRVLYPTPRDEHWAAPTARALALWPTLSVTPDAQCLVKLAPDLTAWPQWLNDAAAAGVVSDAGPARPDDTPEILATLTSLLHANAHIPAGAAINAARAICV